jgi:predicted glutamine amidotransferase
MLLVGNEHRGIDATGMAFSYLDGSVKVFKKDVPSWSFVTDPEYKKFIETNLTDKIWAVLLHTRAATHGNPRDNNNNHPMYAGKSAAIHNGMIQNDNHLFNSLNLDRKAETDSDIIRAIVDKNGITEKCIKELNKLSGSVAAAVVSPDYPQKMLLMRSGSPLTLASDGDHFLFSSERNTLDRALKPWVKRWGMHFQLKRADAAFSPFADNTAWILGAKGQEGHYEFKSLGGKYIEPNRATYEQYKNRQEKWNNASKAIVVQSKVEDALCPKCDKVWTITKGGNPSNFRCNKKKGGCNTALVKLPMIKVN